MTGVTLLWLSAGLSIVGLSALTASLILVKRRVDPASVASVEIAPVMPCAGPLARLDFARSLDPVLFAEAAEEDALAHARIGLRGLIADGTNITLEALKQMGASSEMLVAASSKTAKALRTGEAVFRTHGKSGRALPQVVNRLTGRTMENLKEVGYARKALGGAAAVSTIVVSAAHMIATADLARTLGRVDQKLDLLVAYRQIDQNAALERIYGDARELLASPLDPIRRMEIWRLRGDLAGDLAS